MRTQRLLLTFGVAVLAIAFLVAAVPRRPVTPGKLINVCPGQDCSWGEWRARGDVAVNTNKDVNSEVVFRLAKGDSVTGLGSELVIKKNGTCVATKPIRAYETGTRAPVNLKARDRISTLYNSAEGYVVGNYLKRRIEACCVGDDLDCKTEPQNELWLKVKSQAGAIGWTNQRDKFSGTSD